MNDPLDATLRARLAVSDVRVAAILDGVRARIRRRWILRAAAAMLLPLAVAGTLLARPSAPPAPEADVLVLTRDATSRTDFYAPPELGQLRRESDAAVVVRVLAVDDERVRLAVEEVVYGPPGVDPTSVPERSRRPHSCVGNLEWTKGERCLLFLWRDPETGGFEVKYGAGGKIAFPWSRIFDLPAVREMVKTGTLSADRLAALVGRCGPSAVLRARACVWGHPVERRPGGAPSVQDAVARWAEARLPAPGASDSDMAAIPEVLTPGRLAALPEPVGAALLGAARRKENLYTRLDRLLPLVRAGIPGALEELAAWQRRADEVVPRKFDSSWWRALARARAAQARWQPEAALPKLWEIYEARKLAGGFDRGDVLDLLLDVDPERAGKRLLVYTREAVAAGYAPKVELLVRLPEPAATEALRRAVLTPELGAGWYREELRGVLLGPDGARRLAACAPAIVERVRRGKNDPKHLAVWVGLLAAAPGGIGPVRAEIRAALAGRTGPVEDRAALVRAVGEATGRRLLRWLDPTEEELRAAEDAAIEALR